MHEPIEALALRVLDGAKAFVIESALTVGKYSSLLTVDQRRYAEAFANITHTHRLPIAGS